MKKFCAMLLVVMIAFGCVCGFAEQENTAEGGWWNILLLGGDSRSANAYGRTDCNIILSLNAEAGQAKLTSIMRDTWVKYSGMDKSNKINAANVFGNAQVTLDTVKDCFDLDMENYILVNMTDLIYIIDWIGGVDLEITEAERGYINSYAAYCVQELTDMSEYDGDKTLKNSGYVHLNGLMALTYCRNRTTDSDYQRVMRQQKVLIAMAKRMQEMEIDDLMTMAADVLATVETNLSDEQLEQLAKLVLMMDTEEVGQLRLPADGTYKSGVFDKTWKIVADFKANAKILDDFIYGE